MSHEINVSLEVTVEQVIERMREELFQIDMLTNSFYFRAELMMEEAHKKFPLDLELMMETGIEHVVHDVAGIVKHWDSDSQSYTDCFMPRCTKVGGES